MALAFQWMKYASDDGNVYALKVDADYVDQADRGWGLNADTTDMQYPRGWWPRRVLGTTPAGALREAIVAHVDAPLWSGAAGTFFIRDSSGAMIECVVVGRRRERWLRIKLGLVR